jgi:hypothetical protein
MGVIMKYKVLMLAAAFLILLSSFANAQLVIGDIYSIVNGKEDVLSEDEKIYATLGSILQIKVRFENGYTEEEDVEVDVEIRGTIDDIDDGDSLDKSDDINLNSEEYDHLILEFPIPRITDSDDYYLELEIDAKDENGISYNINRRHKIEVKKSEHEVRINDLSLSKNVVSCDPSIIVYFDILNTGMNHEDDLKFTIDSEELDMHLMEMDWYIEEGEIISIDRIVDLNRDAPAGDYQIEVNAYCNEDRSSIKRMIPIKKEACTNSQVSQPQQTTQQTSTLTSGTTTQQTTQSSSSTNQVISYQNTYVQQNKESPMKKILIINGAIIGVGIVIYLVGSAIIKKK